MIAKNLADLDAACALCDVDARLRLAVDAARALGGTAEDAWELYVAMGRAECEKLPTFPELG